ncbi:MAG: low molecular weight phosphotyrosine protein phosphatase [Prolixibacteraceae bacterium]|jgi:protein-tyrosine phosphatase|nr:low molecular weight phosphotyrosine protein phosphatase [Prolixibacteraceae bacterium]MBT6765824.1 low molecular weight phosphotyrosine protein phosphatase [Prolixibacteraceae bacterium]MBT7000022.1 low molecular weight phosphotyrosine protein phosphatase [Prolixibacteraceae bacterium]MBT7395498.1 low molecular weight phosphotyrosine protein phosphatase [Prolixibacteraceae bacterium]
MEKKNILFVCMGNICRSPSAEAVFSEIVKSKGLSQAFEIDSAGTLAYHVGEPADKRMKLHAVKRDYNLTSISRKFNPDIDFEHFDIIIGMDNENIGTLKNMAKNQEDLDKIKKMTDFSKEWSYSEIPDPYYGGEEGFELVLDLLEDSCQGLLEKLS